MGQLFDALHAWKPGFRLRREKDVGLGSTRRGKWRRTATSKHKPWAKSVSLQTKPVRSFSGMLILTPLRKRLLKNIIRNAVRFTRPGKRCPDRFEGRSGVLRKPLGISFYPGTMVLGVPEGSLQAIFQPFYRNKRGGGKQREGNGLGACHCLRSDSYATAVRSVPRTFGLRASKIIIQLPVAYDIASHGDELSKPVHSTAL